MFSCIDVDDKELKFIVQEHNLATTEKCFTHESLHYFIKETVYLGQFIRNQLPVTWI